MGICCPGCSSRIHPGPLIFNIFVNDIFYVLEKFYNLYNSADDNSLLNTHHSVAELKYNLETSATVASHWFDVNGMKSNQVKIPVHDFK